jgi:hypothetical protein
MILSFKKSFHQLSNIYKNLAMHSIYINLSIHIQNLKQCALYTIMNLNQELYLKKKKPFYRNIVHNLE